MTSQTNQEEHPKKTKWNLKETLNETLKKPSRNRNETLNETLTTLEKP